MKRARAWLWEDVEVPRVAVVCMHLAAISALVVVVAHLVEALA